MDSGFLDELGDIEDLIDVGESRRDREGIKLRVKRKKKLKEAAETVKESSELVSNDSAVGNNSEIPGCNKIFTKTWGCTHNSSDGEYMAGLLAAYGYSIVDDASAADLWLLNSCTVKSPAEDHFRNEVVKAQRQSKSIVVCGCVPQGAPRASYLKGVSMIGVQQIDRVVEVVEETLKGNTVRLLGSKKENGRKAGGASLLLPKIRRNPLIEIIPISTGCLNQCTYCKTKHARGELGSYTPQEIVARAVQAFEEGVVELWITSEDTGAYGRDIGTTLPELLERIVQVIPTGCMMRLGMTNPPYILDHLQEIAEILKHPRVYSFIHIPVQSGSDSVLQDMKREYTRAEFMRVVETLRAEVPGLTVATDIICGFPTETEEEFAETMSLCRKYLFPNLFINQFYPRPGTPAANMQRLPTQEVKDRSRKLTELFRSYTTYDHKVGEVQDVLVTDTAHDEQHYVGHNKYYEQVLVPKDDQFMGKIVRVNIVNTGKHYLQGEPLTECEPVRPTPITFRPRGEVTGVGNDVISSNGAVLKTLRSGSLTGVKPDFYNNTYYFYFAARVAVVCIVISLLWRLVISDNLTI